MKIEKEISMKTKKRNALWIPTLLCIGIVLTGDRIGIKLGDEKKQELVN
jgi:hypothetical protein